MSSEENLKLSVKNNLCTLTLIEVEGDASINKSKDYLTPILTNLMEIASKTLEQDLLTSIRKTAWPSKLSQSTAQGCVSHYLTTSFEDAVYDFWVASPYALKIIVEQLSSSSRIQVFNNILDDLILQDDREIEEEMYLFSLDDYPRVSNLREAISFDEYDQRTIHFEKLSEYSVTRIHDEYEWVSDDDILGWSSLQASQRSIGESIFSAPYPFTVELTGEEGKFYKMTFHIDLLPPEVRPMKEVLIISEADKLLTHMIDEKIDSPEPIHNIIKQMEIPITVAMAIGKEFETLRARYEQAETMRSLLPNV